MALDINEFTNGMTLLIDNEIYEISEFHHVKPGKGSAFVRVKLRNYKTGLVIERTYRSAEKIEEIVLDEKELQYMYRAGENFHFMDQESFEENIISEDNMGDAAKWIQDNLMVTGVYYKGQFLKIILPNFIVYEIIETEPGIKGDSSRAGNKPAKIDTGTNVGVPLFVNTGDFVKIDTRTGQYVERIQK